MRMNPRHVEEIQHKVWGIRPETMRLISAYARGDVEMAEVSKEVVTEEAVSQRLQGGGAVAVIGLQGVITPKGYFSFFGGDSGGLQGFRRALREAVASDDIGSVVINVDSPGGRVDLVPETAADVRAARDVKPVIAVANTMAGSAAYWIASQATELVVTPSGDVGSVGVFIVHEEFSEMDKRIGISTTLIKAGRFKAEGNPYEPLTEEAREHFQSVVDEIYGLFLADVAKGRGVSAAKVRTDFGEGRMLSAKKAVEAGMADRVDTIENVLADLTRGKGGRRRASIPEGVTPGETPGWPIDAQTGELLDLTPEQREALAQVSITKTELENDQVAEGESEQLAQIKRQLDQTTESLKED